MTTILLGILVSLYTSVVKWLERHLIGTSLQGRGAFLLTFGAAAIAASLKVLVFDEHPAVRDAVLGLVVTLSTIFGASQIYYHLIVKTLRPTPPASEPLL